MNREQKTLARRPRKRSSEVLRFDSTPDTQTVGSFV
jgi:hypothetical protein